MKKLVYYHLLFLLSTTLTYSQPELLWNTYFGYNSYDKGSSIIQTSDSNFVICGLTRRPDEEFNSGWLFKVDSKGEMIWEKTYALDQHSWLSSVYETEESGFIIGGSGITNGTGWDCWIIKTDSVGNIIWETSFGDDGTDFIRDFTPTSDNGFFITGWSAADPYGGKLRITKTDSIGEPLWHKTPYNGEGYGIIETSDNNYVVTGEIEGKTCIIKFDQNGNEIWKKILHNSLFGSGMDVIESRNGEYVAISREHNDLYWTHYYGRVVKLSRDGNVVWDKSIKGPSPQEFYSIIETDDEGYLLAGLKSNISSQDEDTYLVKLNSNGQIEWDIAYDGAYSDWAECILQTNNKDFLITGSGNENCIVYAFGNVKEPQILVSNYEFIQNNKEVSLNIKLKNLTDSLFNIQGELKSITDSSIVQKSTCSFKKTNGDSLDNYSDPFILNLHEDINSDDYYFQITLSDGENKIRDYIITHKLDKAAIVFNHQTNTVFTTILSDGGIGSSNNMSIGYGFNYSTNANALFGGGIMVGSPEKFVHGNIQSHEFNDIKNTKSIVLLPSDENFDMISKCSIIDSYPESPFELDIQQFTYSNVNDDYIFIKYSMTNISKEIMDSIYSGVFLDWDINVYNYNKGGFDEKLKLAYQFNNTNATDTSYYGIVVLSKFGGASVVALDEGKASRSKLFELMTSNQISLSEGDQRTYVSSGPFGFAIGETIETDFAIVAGDNLKDLISNALDAKIKWESGLIVNKENIHRISKNYELFQNYPNPFNPSTKIKFGLPSESKVSLVIYNMLGQEVTRLVNQQLKAGYHEVEFNNSSYSSGIYFYRLQAGDYVETKKMILLK